MIYWVTGGLFFATLVVGLFVDSKQREEREREELSRRGVQRILQMDAHNTPQYTRRHYDTPKDGPYG